MMWKIAPKRIDLSKTLDVMHLGHIYFFTGLKINIIIVKGKVLGIRVDTLSIIVTGTRTPRCIHYTLFITVWCVNIMFMVFKCLK